MIRNISLHNFKIHKELSLPLSNLTILAGYNSAGKSSVIQALLLLRQNQLTGHLQDNLDLKGRLCELGLCKDVLCQFADNDLVTIAIENDDSLGNWTFDMGESAQRKTFAKCVRHEGSNEATFNLFTKYFQYISVSRWAPRESYPLDSKAIEEERQISKLLGQCELTPHFLYHYSHETDAIRVPEELKFDGMESSNLLDQVSAWEGAISKSINVKPVPTGTSFCLNYVYDSIGEDFSAINVGSGLTFVLPIVTALLSTPKGGLVIVENPEAHLHPQGQHILAKLIARSAQYGIQVIVETHSDYILNGIMISCKEFVKKGVGLDSANVAIYQFLKDEETQLSEPNRIKIGTLGNITNQPRGFFDQMNMDMECLLDIE